MVRVVSSPWECEHSISLVAGPAAVALSSKDILAAATRKRMKRNLRNILTCQSELLEN